MEYGDDKRQEMLPQLLAYQEKAVSPAVVSSRYYVSPNNGNTFTASASTGSVIRMDIPASTVGQHLNPYESTLVFSVVNKTAANCTCTIDGNAFSFIQSIVVYYGSTLISSIENYDCYANAISDFTSSGEHFARGVADVALPATYGNGELVADALVSRNGRAIPFDGTDSFAMPLVNLLGTLAQKGIPLSQLRDAIKIEIRLNNLLDIGVYSTAPPAGSTIVVQDVKLWLTNVQISSSVENALIRSLNGIVQTPVFDVENFRTSINANTSSFTYQIPIRCSSLTSVFFCLREASRFNNREARALARTTGNLKSYNFRIGSALVPSSPINCAGSAPEARMEVMRALNAIGQAQSDSFINHDLFTMGGATAMGLGQYGGRLYGLQLSAFASSELLSDGKNLKTETLVLDLSFNTGGNVALQLDVYCVFEKVLTVAQGVMTYKN